jgi:hypothetical protein
MNMKKTLCLFVLISLLTPYLSNAQLSDDIAVIGQVAPTCVSSMDETICVRLYNNGINTETGFPISYWLSSYILVTEIYTGTLSPGDESTYCFDIPVDLINAMPLLLSGSTFNVVVQAGNSNPYNDTLRLVAPDFLCTGLPYCPSCGINPGHQEIVGVQIGSYSHNTTAFGSNHSSFFNIPFDQLGSNSSYPFTLITRFAPGNTTQYNCTVEAYLDLNKDGVYDSSGPELLLSSPIQSEDTLQTTINIPSSLNGLNKLRIVLAETANAALVNPCGTYQNGETENYFFFITDSSTIDLELLTILTPQSGYTLDSVLRISVKNNGYEDLWNIPVSFQVDTNTLVLETITDTITPGLPYTYIFQNPVNFIYNGIDNDFELCVNINFPDAVPGNNSICDTVVIQGLGFDNNLAASEFRIYPNPVSNFVYFDSSLKLTEGLVCIYNELGQQVARIPHSQNKVDVSFLNPGTYIIEFAVGAYSFRQKIIVFR